MRYESEVLNPRFQALSICYQVSFFITTATVVQYFAYAAYLELFTALQLADGATPQSCLLADQSITIPNLDRGTEYQA